MQRIAYFELPQPMSAQMKIGVCAVAVAVLALGGVAVASRQSPSPRPSTAQTGTQTTPHAAPQTAVQAPAGDQHVWSQDPASKCRFVAPRSLPSGPTYWTGACPD